MATVIQAVSFNGGFGTGAETLTLASTTAGHSMVVAAASGGTGAAQLSATSFSFGTGWVQDLNYVVAASVVEVWRCPSIPGAQTALTITPAGANNIASLVVIEASGISGVDKTSTNTASTSPISSGAFTPAAVNELLVSAGWFSAPPSAKPTPTSGFTEANTVNYGASYYGEAGYLLDAAQTSIAATYSYAGTITWIEGAVAYLNTAAASGSGYMGWLAVLNELAGTKNLGENAAANAYASTKNLGLPSALNVKAGTKNLGLNAVCNALAGTKNLEALHALNVLAGNGAP